MRVLFSSLLLLIVSVCSAQKNKIDTIEVSFHKTVVIIFETPILSDDVGSTDVLIKREGKILKVAADIEDFHETTLFVETEAGYYSFIVRFNDNPKKLSHYYSSANVNYSKVESSPSTVSEQKNTKEGKPLSLASENAYYKDCEDIAKRANSIHDLGVISTKVSFMLTDIYIKNDLLFFKVLVKNNSNIDYDIELMKFLIKGKKGTVKQSAVQESQLQPEFVYNNDVNEIKGKDGVIKVFVFKKFTFSDEKKLYIDLWENGGDRILSFFIPSDRILNVKKL